MYVSIKNLLKFVRNPTEYPEYWEKQKQKEAEAKKIKLYKRYQIKDHGSHFRSKNLLPVKNNLVDFDIDLDENAKLYAGYVFFVPPHRHKLGKL